MKRHILNSVCLYSACISMIILSCCGGLKKEGHFRGGSDGSDRRYKDSGGNFSFVRPGADWIKPEKSKFDVEYYHWEGAGQVFCKVFSNRIGVEKAYRNMLKKLEFKEIEEIDRLVGEEGSGPILQVLFSGETLISGMEDFSVERKGLSAVFKGRKATVGFLYVSPLDEFQDNVSDYRKIIETFTFE